MILSFFSAVYFTDFGASYANETLFRSCKQPLLPDVLSSIGYRTMDGYAQQRHLFVSYIKASRVARPYLTNVPPVMLSAFIRVPTIIRYRWGVYKS